MTPKQELMKKAKEIGIDVPFGTSNENIKKLIAEAMANNPENAGENMPDNTNPENAPEKPEVPKPSAPFITNMSTNTESDFVYVCCKIPTLVS